MEQPWSATACRLPDSLPTMITPPEASYLRWLGETFWDGRSDVVEVGPWLGGSTWCLASGMARRDDRDPAARLHAVDNFRWRSFMSARGPALEDGASFRQLFEENLAPFAPLLEVHEVRLPDEHQGDIELGAPGRDYDSGLPLLADDAVARPVQILFVDGAKSFPAFAHMLHVLAPHLTDPALLVLQDYKAPHAYWVPIAIEKLRRAAPGCLSIAHALPANTVAWRLGGPLGSATGVVPRSLDEVGAAEGRELLSSAAAELAAAGDPAGARIVELAAVPFAAAKDGWDAAREELARAERRWPVRDPAHSLVSMAEWLQARSGQPTRRTATGLARRAYAWTARLRPHLGR